MKKRYYISTAVISYFVLLITTIPAHTITTLINDNAPVRIQGVSGTLWHGKAIEISINDDLSLSDTTWSFSTLALFTGHAAAQIETRLLDNKISAEVGSSFLGRFFIDDLKAKLPASDIVTLANIPLAQLSGDIAIDIESARWKQGELPTASGQIYWSNASVTVMEAASLGNISITLGESEQQLLKADIKNQGGDINIDGYAGLVPEANYAVNIKLKANAGASNNIRQSLSMFAKRQADGSFLFKKTGSLNQIGLM
ncbi:MAG: type II secretion system protein N [Proteobacteria bacterium]|nr:type II secretion system protein N [Pseudomonadota bacterium]